MRSVFVTTRNLSNFYGRFPEAVSYLRENNVEIIQEEIVDSSGKYNPKLYDTPVLFVTTDKCDRQLIDNLSNLRLICKMGSGTENIDLDACREKGIAVSNSRGANANAVAEHTLLLILASLRRLKELYRYAEEGAWAKRFAGEELQGKKIGLIGFGRIAQRLAELLIPFNVEIMTYDPYIDRKKAESLHIDIVDFPVLLQSSDIISLHVPLTAENNHMINSNTIATMKTGAVLVNAARGPLVDENALYEALSKGKLSASAVDVWEEEPLSPQNRLFTLDNFIGTPHIAGSTRQTALADSMIVAHSIVECLDDLPISMRVV